MKNSAHIHQIETAVPEYSFKQNELREIMKDIVGTTEREKRIIHHLYAKSGIDTRYSVIDDFSNRNSPTLFFNGQGTTPGTKSRNDLYIKQGRKLFVEVAQKLLENSEFETKDITHLVTVSCTGFYAPGPDFDIIDSLGLNSSIERYHLGFMGCYASIPALKMARQFCESDKDATVLVVSVELCSIHFQANPKMDNLLSSTVFSDGGAGAIVSSRAPKKSHFRIDGFASSINKKGADDMAWSIGDNGFNMILSSYIPNLLKEGMDDFLLDLMNQFQIKHDDIERWAIHPGGKAILDKLEASTSVPDGTLRASRDVLSNFGNMSSATILFVLKELMDQPSESDQEKTLAMAFGPGLTLESALLSKKIP
ncbi:MAG: type III polyketide synthase [Balneolaceae bacterium]|nr:type III polyketide synthase [Balneolaceae bacterium]